MHGGNPKLIVEKIQVSLNSDKSNVTVHEGQCICKISRQILHCMRNISDKSCRENQKTHFMFSNFCFRK